MKPGFALALCGLFLLSSNASAAVLHYAETVDGDLDFQTLLLGAGNNTISGTWSLHPFDDTITDPDGFYIVVPTGHAVTGINHAAVTDILINPPNYLIRENLHLDIAGGAFLGYTTRAVTTAPYSEAVFPGIYPLPADTYSIYQRWTYELVIGGGPPRDFDKDDLAQVSYTWTIDVAAVPEVPVPAAFWLFGTALIGIAGFKRRQQVL